MWRHARPSTAHAGDQPHTYDKCLTNGTDRYTVHRSPPVNALSPIEQKQHLPHRCGDSKPDS